ncbi:MAG: hypothetical protein V1856_03725 [Candidatus Liptonbacteria bacterium]
MGKDIIISREEENALRAKLAERKDAEAERELRFLNMPDLSRTPGNPLYEIVEKARQVPVLADFDNIIIPEIVPAEVSFDHFDFPPDHPARSRSDTYYTDDTHILRTHDTVMWYYYTQHPEIKERIARKESFGVVCYGKVYRKDEIDRKHMNIFHQFGGWYLTPIEKEKLTIEDLKNVLSQIVRGLFGPSAHFRFNQDAFPYTDPSLEVEVEIGGQWIEVLGCGMTTQSVFKKFGVEGYNAWAFGFGLERLAIISMKLPDIRLLWSEDERIKRQLKLGNIFKEVSKYPPITRDISFVVDKSFVPNNYFDLIRDIGGDLIEEVSLLDKYENAEKFGADKLSYTYRIIYRSTERTLQTEEIEPIQNKIIEGTKNQFGGEVR